MPARLSLLEEFPNRSNSLRLAYIVLSAFTHHDHPYNIDSIKGNNPMYNK